MKGALFATTLLCWLVASPALARVERFAVVIGNNQGAVDEAPLAYAESDAARVYDVLSQIGDVSPLNSLLIRGRDASFVRGALLTINERIRDAATVPDTQVVLIVYFSGHADAQALHLMGTELPLLELRQLAYGSAANFRLVIVDACRSGALTHVKGGQRIAPFALPETGPEPPPGDGVAFLTATSANEDAQESDELQASFFTQAFVTGLLGAADSDMNGSIVLDEVYRYAYAATLRATSRTFAGTQHPTFQYNLRGRGEWIITRPSAHSTARANVAFPAGSGFILLRDSDSGAVALELEPSAHGRTLSLAPGHYFVRARAPDVMYEGMLEATAGTSSAIALGDMTRIQYARLVRKGARASMFAHGPLVGASLRSSLPNETAACLGAFVSYALDVSRFGVRARFGTCASSLENSVLRASVLSYDLELHIFHAWELSRLSLEIGLGGGAVLFDQHFEIRGNAPARLTLAPFIAPGIGSQLDLGAGYHVDLSLSAETYFMRVQNADQRTPLTAAFALRARLGLGKYF